MQQHVWVTAAIFVLFTALGVSSTTFGLILSDATESLGISLAYAGLVSTLFAAGRTAGSLLNGPLTDRWGERTMTLLGTLGLIAGLALIASAVSPGLFFGGSLLMGLGWSALDVALNTHISKLHPQRRSAMLSLLHGFYGVGSFVGPLLLGLSITWYTSWRSAPWVAGALFALAGLAYAATSRLGKTDDGPSAPRIEEQLSSVKGAADRAQRMALGDPTLWLIASIGLIYQGVAWSLSLWLPTYMVSVHGTSSLAGASAISALFAGLTVGRFVNSLVVRRLGDLNTLLAGAVGSLIALTFSLAVSSPLLLFVGLTLTGLALSPLIPTAIAVLTRRWPETAGTVSGVFMMWSSVGVLFFPWFLGVLSDIWDMRAGLGVGVVALLFLTGVVLLLRRALAREGEQAST